MRMHQFVGKRTYTLINIYKNVVEYNILFFCSTNSKNNFTVPLRIQINLFKM